MCKTVGRKIQRTSLIEVKASESWRSRGSPPRAFTLYLVWLGVNLKIGSNNRRLHIPRTINQGCLSNLDVDVDVLTDSGLKMMRELKKPGSAGGAMFQRSGRRTRSFCGEPLA